MSKNHLRRYSTRNIQQGRQKSTESQADIFERSVDPFVRQSSSREGFLEARIFETDSLLRRPRTSLTPVQTIPLSSSTSAVSPSALPLHDGPQQQVTPMLTPNRSRSQSHVEMDNFIPTCLDQTAEIFVDDSMDLDEVQVLNTEPPAEYPNSGFNDSSQSGYDSPFTSAATHPLITTRKLSFVEKNLRLAFDNGVNPGKESSGSSSNIDTSGPVSPGAISRRLSLFYFPSDISPHRDSVQGTNSNNNISDHKSIDPHSSASGSKNVKVIPFYSYYDLLDFESSQPCFQINRLASCTSSRSQSSISTGGKFLEEKGCTNLDDFFYNNDKDRDGVVRRAASVAGDIESFNSRVFSDEDECYGISPPRTLLKCRSMSELLRVKSREIRNLILP